MTVHLKIEGESNDVMCDVTVETVVLDLVPA